MWQTAAVILAVAAAALWVGWSILLPKKVRRRLAQRLGRPNKSNDCGCGG